jgi:hypothetical protein
LPVRDWQHRAHVPVGRARHHRLRP